MAGALAGGRRHPGAPGRAAEKAPPPARLWETLVAQKIASDEQILTALSTRFRLKLADLAQLDPAAKERVPSRWHAATTSCPLRATDSYLEVATANPFDLDAEKGAGVATAREIRMFLLAPSKIANGWTSCTVPRRRSTNCSKGMESSASLEHLQDTAPDELVASEAEASQRPVVRLVDLIISEGSWRDRAISTSSRRRAGWRCATGSTAYCARS